MVDALDDQRAVPTPTWVRATAGRPTPLPRRTICDCCYRSP